MNTQNDQDLDFDFETDDVPQADESGLELEQINDGDIPGTEGEGNTVETVNASGEGETTVVTDNSEAPVEGETTAPVELTDEQKAAKAEADKAAAAAKAKAEEEEREVALNAFKETVEGVFSSEDYDSATGTLPVALTQVVVDAYTGLPGAKAKSAARTYLQDSMQENMIKGTTDGPSWFMRARTFMELNNKVTTTKTSSPSAAREKVDPTQAHINRVAAMLLAPNFVQAGEGVEAGWETKAEELVTSLVDDATKYRDWLNLTVKEGEEKPAAPEVSDVVIAAAKIAVGRVATTKRASSGGNSTPRVSTAGSGHRGDIGKHIREVMDTVPVGAFLSIAEIAKAETSQYGGATMPPPSQGAIAARLFPAKGVCTLDFVSPEGKDEGRPVKGAVRTA